MRISKHSLWEKSIEYEGLIFNGVFALYVFLLSPHVLEMSKKVMYDDETSYFPTLGAVLLVLFFAESYALPKKMRYVIVYLSKDNEEDSFGGLFLLWMFHAVISVLVIMVALQSLGIDVTAKDNPYEGWMALLLFSAVIKELYLLIAVFMGDDFIEKEKYPRPNRKEWFYDVLLATYACIVYTVVWETIASNVKDDSSTPLFLAIPVASLIFLMFYIPVRIPYLLEETSKLKSDKDYLTFFLSWLLVLVPVMRAQFFG